jgi:hypothetical protein
LEGASAGRGFLAAPGATIYPSLADKAAIGKEMSLAELRAIPAEDFLTRKTVDGAQTLYDALNDSFLSNVIDGYDKAYKPVNATAAYRPSLRSTSDGLL